MSVDNPQHRADDNRLAILCQKFDDYVLNTDKYRTAQEKIQENISIKLDKTTKEIFDRLSLLQCPVHKTRLDDLGKAVIGLWIVVGCIGAAVLAEVMKFWNK